MAATIRMCGPIDDPVGAARLGWAADDLARRLRRFVDAYGLDGPGRVEVLAALDATMAAGGSFVRRRVEAGDPNFIAMLDQMGGMERYDRRRRWWDDNRSGFVQVLDLA